MSCVEYEVGKCIGAVWIILILIRKTLLSS